MTVPAAERRGCLRARTSRQTFPERPRARGVRQIRRTDREAHLFGIRRCTQPPSPRHRRREIPPPAEDWATRPDHLPRNVSHNRHGIVKAGLSYPKLRRGRTRSARDYADPWFRARSPDPWRACRARSHEDLRDGCNSGIYLCGRYSSRPSLNGAGRSHRFQGAGPRCTRCCGCEDTLRLRRKPGRACTEETWCMPARRVFRRKPAAPSWEFSVRDAPSHNRPAAGPS